MTPDALVARLHVSHLLNADRVAELAAGYRQDFGDEAADAYMAELLRLRAELAARPDPEEEHRAVQRLAKHGALALDDFMAAHQDAFGCTSESEALRKCAEVVVAYLLGHGLAVPVPPSQVPPVVIGGEVLHGTYPASVSSLPSHLRPSPPLPRGSGEAPAPVPLDAGTGPRPDSI